MKSILLFAASASLSILVAGCGNSGADVNAPTLATDTNSEQNALNSHCLNNPQSQNCIQNQNKAEQSGFRRYEDYSSQSGFGDASFNFAGGFCGCDSNETPTVVNGNLMCATQTVTNKVEEMISVEVDFETDGYNTSQQTKLSYKYVETNHSETTVSNPNRGCPGQAQVGCYPNDPMACRGIKDNYGDIINANCVRVEGKNYGQCIKQVIVNPNNQGNQGHWGNQGNQNPWGNQGY